MKKIFIKSSMPHSLCCGVSVFCHSGLTRIFLKDSRQVGMILRDTLPALRRGVFIIALILNLFLVSSCHPARIDGPYQGRIIDADTRQPIEGVVVLGVWYKEYPFGATGGSEFYDAEETLTDKNGDFEIKGQGLLVLSFIDEMNVLIFKAGYEYIGFGPWVSLKGQGFKEYKTSYDPVTKTKVTAPVFDPKERVHWEGDKAIIPLKKLTIDEMRKSGLPSRPPIPVEKMKLLTSEINKARVMLRLEPFDLGENNK